MSFILSIFCCVIHITIKGLFYHKRCDKQKEDESEEISILDLTQPNKDKLDQITRLNTFVNKKKKPEKLFELKESDIIIFLISF